MTPTWYDGPEAPLDAVARGDFRQLSRPLLVACGSRRDLADFMDRWAFEPHEIRRYRGGEIEPRNRVLITLPGWHDSKRDRAAVADWVRREGYTVEMDSVSPAYWRRETLPVGRYLAWLAAALVAVWLISLI